MKLTPLSKLLIVVIVIAGAGAGLYSRRDEPAVRDFIARFTGGGADTPAAPPKPGDPPPAPKAAGKHRIVVGVNDFGGAYPGLVANDGVTAGARSLFAKAGIDVEVKLVRGSKERLEQFEAGKIDVMLLTLDYVANLYADYQAKGIDVRTFFFVDWSRGNLGLVTKPGFTSIESLKKARIATTRNTPTHYFTLVLLDRSNLKPNEVELIKGNLVWAKKTPDAGDLFTRGEVDAVAIWEPHLTRAIAANGKLLVSTTTATNLIADVLFARAGFLDEHADIMPAFIQAWLEGVKLIHDDPARSIEVISKAFAQTPEETKAVLGKIKLANFADNRAFFGLETESSPYATLVREAGQIWQREGVIAKAPVPRETVRTGFLEKIKETYKQERIVENWKFEKGKAGAEALFSKSVSIFFPSGSAELDANARKILDGFAETVVGVFQNAYVRVEGNTDSAGQRKSNVTLSEKRAQAVTEYLVARHRFDPDRFVAVGNGPDRPVGDNKTAEGREWNRRTDFRVVPNP